MLTLRRATGGVVFWIEVEDDDLAEQGAQLNVLAASGGKFNVWCRFVQHAGVDQLRFGYG